MSADPVYAMIEEHKALSAAYGAACEDGRNPKYEVEVGRTGEALDDGAKRLLTFKPLTLPGVVAMLRYLSGLEDWQVPGRFNDDFSNMKELSASVAAAVEAIIRKGGEA